MFSVKKTVVKIGFLVISTGDFQECVKQIQTEQQNFQAHSL